MTKLHHRPEQPQCLRGFENVNRYWDGTHKIWAAKILPGEYYVTYSPEEAVITTLGSCVSACIRDIESGLGGMNHFMLPEGDHTAVDLATRYGSYAMEHLINEILRNGGKRDNLEVKLVGGGQIIANMSDVGQRNIDFVMTYVGLEGLRLVAKDLGDIYPRKVMYYPSTGRMRVKRLRSLHNDTIFVREQHYKQELAEEPVSGEVELF